MRHSYRIHHLWEKKHARIIRHPTDFQDKKLRCRWVPVMRKKKSHFTQKSVPSKIALYLLDPIVGYYYYYYFIFLVYCALLRYCMCVLCIIDCAVLWSRKNRTCTLLISSYPRYWFWRPRMSPVDLIDSSVWGEMRAWSLSEGLAEQVWLWTLMHIWCGSDPRCRLEYNGPGTLD